MRANARHSKNHSKPLPTYLITYLLDRKCRYTQKTYIDGSLPQTCYLHLHWQIMHTTWITECRSTKLSKLTMSTWKVENIKPHQRDFIDTKSWVPNISRLPRAHKDPTLYKPIYSSHSPGTEINPRNRTPKFSPTKLHDNMGTGRKQTTQPLYLGGIVTVRLVQLKSVCFL